ncbi:MAG: DNA-3-methyladenine glycosylase I [Anaerolineae bacterium]|jgi:DNA-3-methyladenine glycosylase I|nr:DNA-3-methyladenine glycosylase I [Anaerolineae bacterium]
MKQRCEWAVGDDKLMVKYHDEEWGVPVHDDRLLFEFLILEGAQAGLSWSTILNKRKNYRRAFDRFDIARVSRYNEAQVGALANNPGIVRHKRKIVSAVNNAQAALRVIEEFGSLDAYLWSFVGGKPIINHYQTMAEIPTQTAESEAMSKDLKKRGFNFVGPTICYAFMEAVGMVNDHEVDCFRWQEVQA